MKLSERTQRNIGWIESNLRVPDGRLVGQPIKLSPAQRRWMEMIYGTPTRTFICSIPRKNGKSTFAAMLLLLHLVGYEAVENGQIYSTAMSRDQASILFHAAAKMVRMSEPLMQYVKVKDSAKQLICPELGTSYRALSADAPTALGLNSSMVIHDELGQVRGPKSDLFEALETSAAAQSNPLSIIISTQAPNENDLLSLLIEQAKTGADKRVKCVVYAVPEEDDPFDHKTLAKAQPNWHLMNHDEVHRQADEAKRMPSRAASFRNLVANQRVEMHSPFISRDVMLANGGDVDAQVFYDNPVYVGLDLSARNDLTAMVMVASDGQKWHVKTLAWTPADTLKDRATRDRAPYDVWAEQGYLHALPGASMDYEALAVEIADALEGCELSVVAFDRWRMDILQRELERINIELPLMPFGQGFKDMSPALEATESALLNHQMAHGNNPVLIMCMANARVQTDPAGNRKLDKRKATGRIDAAVALCMAMGAAARGEEYDTQDLSDYFQNAVVG